ncbi:HAD-IIIA family hydrolase [Lewinella sp. LCG006]|uniref:HAD-IIIA family hydrolase n=1 Tax=Lewinella sp. LCG006 TaxID=3231911 RepID=UPI0034604893
MISNKPIITALIPLRGGSKSIPDKNIKDLANKPLLCHVVDAALRCELISTIVIATDSEKIKDVVRQHYGQQVEIFDRSPDTATDTAPTEAVVLEYAECHTFEHLVLIQATSPLLEAKDLTGGINKYLTGKARGLLSVVRQKRFLWEESAGNAHPLNYEYQYRPRRQDFSGFLVENGAFYLTSREALLQSRCRISSPVLTWEMPAETYYELDEPEDWFIVEQILLHRLSKAPGELAARAGDIRLLLTDVDGVLTDAGMYYTENGDELKKFNTRDGMGMAMLQKQGIRIGIITSENTKLVERRAQKLGVDFLYQGKQDKAITLEKILTETGLKTHQVAYIGDDLNDIKIIKAVGLSACPNNAVDEIKKGVDIVLSAKGGEGAVREFAEMILKSTK